jgi:YbgC/YbaW family acyl-CoA thioester hydrolase
MKHLYHTQIRERHLDSFGHVNNAQYLVLFEEARWEMITSRGYGLREVHQTKISTVILECSVKFKSELPAREKITIETDVVSFNKKIGVIRHRIFKQDQTIAAEAEFKIGCFDLNSRKLITPSAQWLHAITGE